MKDRRSVHPTSRFASILLSTGSLAALLAAPACGGEDSGNGDGDGDGVSTGGVVGDGDTGTGGLGTGGNGTGGNGTGGAGTGGVGTGGGGTGGEGTGGEGTGGDGTGGEGTGGGGGTDTAFNCDPAEGAIPTLALEEVEGGFDEPVLVTHAGDERLFVVERGGEIHVIEGGATLGAPFLVVDDVDTSGFGERGLLGLAFHPDHATNGLLYIYYTQEDGAQATSRVVEYSVMEDDPNQVDTSTEREVLAVAQPDQNHNGGQLAFGPDGMLYFALGDGGGSGDPDDNGQTPSTLLGSLIRIDPTGRDDGAYTVPAGNLSEVMGSAAPEVFSYGLRNPYRYNFDLCTGDLYIGDVGQNAYEEINVTPSGVGQLNYGWNTMEGTHCYDPMTGCDQTGLTLPLYDYERGGGAAVTGGTVYRGSEIPALRGKYFFADSQQSGGRLWYTEYDPAGPSLADPTEITGEVGGPGAIVSIQNGPDGEIYMTQYGGTVVKLVAAQ